MKQLREKFTPIKKGLRSGQEYLLLYRSKPLAMIKPYQEDDLNQNEDTANKKNQKKSKPKKKQNSNKKEARPKEKKQRNINLKKMLTG